MDPGVVPRPQPLSLLLERGAGYASALSLSEREGASLSTESDACIPKGGRGGGLEGYNTSYSNSKGSSETTCDITYNFEEYSNLIPQQKKKINKNFLE